MDGKFYRTPGLQELEVGAEIREQIGVSTREDAQGSSNFGRHEGIPNIMDYSIARIANFVARLGRPTIWELVPF